MQVQVLLCAPFFLRKLANFFNSRTDSAQILLESEPPKMKFPKVIRHRNAEVTIYGKKKNYPIYRSAYRADGKRQLRSFSKYSDALKEADKKAKQLAEGHPAVALSAADSRDALIAIQMLDSFRPQGKRLSLAAVVSEFIDVSKRVGDRTLRDVADGFLTNVAAVTRKDLGDAINEFLVAADARAKANGSDRPQVSSKYASNRRLQLQKFAASFTGTAVCDLTKAHLDQFIQTLGAVTSKSPRLKSTDLPNITMGPNNYRSKALAKFKDLFFTYRRKCEAASHLITGKENNSSHVRL